MTKGKKAWSIIKTLVLIGLAVFLLGLVGLLSAFAYFSKDLPSPNKINMRQVAESTKIYDRTGEILLYDIHGPEKRTVVALDNISDYVKWAIIAIEDENFYSHYGIDLRAIARAFWANIRGKAIKQGGSTITQQLIKNSILTTDKTYSRKFKELILALETERKFTKDQILQMYLNEIPFGANVYGIEAAAQSFFNKSASELDLAQSAVLAALPKAPTYYSPYGSHCDELEIRQEIILRRMADLGFITQEQAQQAMDQELEFAVARDSIIAPHFVLYVKELLAQKYGEDVLQKDGLKVITTLDVKLQRIAEQTIEQYDLEQFNASNAALVSIDPKTGQVLAMVGSRDYFDTANDGNVNVCLALRQPGSSFKPFVYATAFKQGFTPENVIYDSETNFGVYGDSEYIPGNYDNKFRGPVTMRRALSSSINVPSVKTLYLAGVKESIKTASDMGITTLTDPQRYGLSLVLGGGEVKLLEETAAYGVFANDGIKHKTNLILEVKGRTGKVLEEYNNKGERVLSKQVARLITDVIRRSPRTSPSQNAYHLEGREAAAKTGTTQGYRDAWTVGYTPSLVTGVWVGNNDNSPMVKRASINIATPLWNNFMSIALADSEVENLPYPEPIEKTPYQLKQIVKIDSITGKLATEHTPANLIVEKEFYLPHSILYLIDKNDSQFESWEQGVQDWIEKHPNEIKTPPQEEDDVHTEENQPKITIEQLTADELSLKVKVEIEANFSIKQVEFFLDNELLDTDKNKPFVLNKTGLPSGEHILKIKAYDTKGNKGEFVEQVNIIE